MDTHLGEEHQRCDAGRSGDGARRLGLALGLYCALSAYAQPNYAQSRGELLYAAHCGECHSTQVHWRTKKSATDRESLKTEVRRWQDNLGLRWSEEDVAAVSDYLDRSFYRFPSTAATDSAAGGTWFLARLPPGRYALGAESLGRTQARSLATGEKG